MEVLGEIGAGAFLRRPEGWAAAGVAASTLCGLLSFVCVAPPGRPDEPVAPMVGALALGALAAAALCFRRVYQQLLDARALRLDARGFDCQLGGRPRRIAWNRVSACRADLKRGAVVLDVEGEEKVELRPSWYRNAGAIWEALRRHCPGYALTTVDETWMGLDLGQRKLGSHARELLRRKGERPRLSLLETTEPRPSYRSAGGSREWLAPSVWRSLSEASVDPGVALLCLLFVAAAVVELVVVLAPTSPPWLLPVTALTVVLAVLGPLPLVVNVARGTRLLRRERAFFGPMLRERTPGVWENPEGSRRLRMTDHDSRGSWLAPHQHMDEIGRDGTTEVTYVLALCHDSEPSPALRSWTAYIEPESWRPTCFDGLPWDRPKPYSEPRHLLLQDILDGFVLTRFDDHLAYAGDTWHATRAGAERQIEVELGVTAGWRPLDEAPVGYGFLTR